MRNDKIYNITMGEKKGIGDFFAEIWHRLSNDKILTGMGCVTILALIGTAFDKDYSVKFGKDIVDLHPEDS